MRNTSSNCLNGHYDVTKNPSKNVFRQSKVIFLGYEVNAGGIQPPKKRISEMVRSHQPKSIKTFYTYGEFLSQVHT